MHTEKKICEELALDENSVVSSSVGKPLLEYAAKLRDQLELAQPKPVTEAPVPTMPGTPAA